MRAVAIGGFGAPPEIMDLPVPEPGPGEILLRVHAAGMNPFDWKVIDGALRETSPHAFPLVLGNDAGGVVERTGAGVTRFAVGDRVFGQFMNVSRGLGSYAEYTVASEDGNVSQMPGDLSFPVAAALPTASAAAWNAVIATGVTGGQWLLINGATGGVGQSAVQFASDRGATVLATASPDAAGPVHELGAKYIIDYTKGSTTEQVRAVAPDGVDAVLDLVSTTAARTRELAALIRPGGILVSTNGAADAGSLGELGIHAVNFGNRTTASLLATLAQQADTGKLKIRIDAKVPLNDGPAAIAGAKAGHAWGKTVLIP